MKLRELRITYTRSREPVTLDRRGIRTPADSAAVLVPILRDEPQEIFGVLVLTTKHTIIGFHEVHRGALAEVEVSPAAVFRVALLTNAGAMILAHNHPSGDCTPSPEDIALTQRLRQGADLLGVTILDHVIVGNGCYLSFVESGRWL